MSTGNRQSKRGSLNKGVSLVALRASHEKSADVNSLNQREKRLFPGTNGAYFPQRGHLTTRERRLYASSRSA
eukprot:364398-Chlamydomonas_euryale.AAC.20